VNPVTSIDPAAPVVGRPASALRPSSVSLRKTSLAFGDLALFAGATSAICHGPSRQPEPHIKGLETSLIPFVSAHSPNKQETCVMNRHTLHATAAAVAL
jgi:hypothetical protein